VSVSHETDTWQGSLGKVTMGRPKISDEELVGITFKLPKSQLALIERIAKDRGETRSEFLREVVSRATVSELAHKTLGTVHSS
jgi:uncharacterized protein (DUF1778 family)